MGFSIFPNFRFRNTPLIWLALPNAILVSVGIVSGKLAGRGSGKSAKEKLSTKESCNWFRKPTSIFRLWGVGWICSRFPVREMLQDIGLSHEYGSVEQDFVMLFQRVICYRGFVRLMWSEIFRVLVVGWNTEYCCRIQIQRKTIFFGHLLIYTSNFNWKILKQDELLHP